MVHTQRNIKNIFHVVNRFIKSILSEYNYCRKVVKKYFCKNLIMSAEEDERSEMTNIC